MESGVKESQPQIDANDESGANLPTVSKELSMGEENVASSRQEQQGSKKSSKAPHSATQKLLEKVYNTSATISKLKKSDIQDLAVSPANFEEDAEYIGELTIDDRLLAVPLRILIALVEFGTVGQVRDHMVKLAWEAVQRNPSAQCSEIREYLHSLDAVLDPEKLINSLNQVREKSSSEHLVVAYKVADVSKLIRNLQAIVALKKLLGNQCSLEQVIDEMAQGVWKTKTRGHLATAAVLITAKDVEALGLLSLHYSERMRQQVQLMVLQEKSAIHQAKRASEAEADRDSLAEQCLRLEEQIARLKEEALQGKALIALEVEARSMDAMRHVSQIELLRTRTLKTLRDQSDLLGDAIHAQDAGSTKTALEFMSRTKTAIDAEILKLVTMGEA